LISDSDRKKLEAARKYFECLGRISLIVTEASNYVTFRAMYPKLLDEIDKAENEIKDIEKIAGALSIPDIHIIENLYYYAKYYVEAMKDFQSWNFDAGALEKAIGFFKNYLTQAREVLEWLESQELLTKEDIQEIQEEWKKVEPMLKTSLEALEAFKWNSKAGANMALGNFNEGAIAFEKVMSIISKSGNKELNPLYGITEANLWFARAMGYQYEDGNFLEAAKTFEKSSKLFERLAAREEDPFSKGTYQAYNTLCEKRASLCIALYNKIETRRDYKEIREEMNAIRRSFWRT